MSVCEIPFIEQAFAAPEELPADVRYSELVEPVELSSAQEDATRRTWRERLTTRTGKSVMGIVTALGFVGGATTAEAPAANASTPVYAVTNAAAGGVYARYAPHVNSTNHTPGFGIYPGDKVQLLCGVTNGDAVGPHNNHSWDFVKDLSRKEGNFWTSEHYTNSPNAANTLAPGEAKCANESSNPLANNTSPKPQPAAPKTPNYKGNCKVNTGAVLLESWNNALAQWDLTDGELKSQLERYDENWGNPDADEVCVGAQLSKPDPAHGNGEYISSVVSTVPDLNSNACSAAYLVEVWGNGFYRSTDCLSPKEWHPNIWLKSGSWICAAYSSAYNYNYYKNDEAAAAAVKSGKVKLGASDPWRAVTCVSVK